MPYDWPEDTDFAFWELGVLDRKCPTCGRMMHVCDHRSRRFHTLQGPVELTCRLDHCPDPDCPAHCRTLSPLAEAQLTLPYWLIGWDVFSWLGFRRFTRHWSIPQLQSELRDTYRIHLSDDAISGYLQRYRCMVAARHQDQALLAEHYKDMVAKAPPDEEMESMDAGDDKKPENGEKPGAGMQNEQKGEHKH